MNEPERANRENDSQPLPGDSVHPPVYDLVMADIAKRNEIGIKRYGVPLSGFNGRDALLDAYEEALDLAMYLRQEIYERDFSHVPQPGKPTINLINPEPLSFGDQIKKWLG